MSRFCKDLCRALTGGGWADIDALETIVERWGVDVDRMVNAAEEFEDRCEFNALMYSAIDLALAKIQEDLREVLNDIGIDCDVDIGDVDIYVNYLDSSVDDEILDEILHSGITLANALEFAYMRDCVEEYDYATFDGGEAYVFKDGDEAWFGIEAGECQYICELPPGTEIEIEKTQGPDGTGIRVGRFAYLVADDRIVLVEQAGDKTGKKIWECTRR